jgi:hypothetical protein
MRNFFESPIFLSYHQNAKKLCFLIFFVAVGLRLILFLSSAPWNPEWPKKMVTSDSFEYFMLGQSLLERGVFSYTWPEPMPHALRLPGYPVFVAFTSMGAQKDWLWLTSLTQILLDSLFAVLLMRIIGDLFSNANVGFLASIIYSVSPDAIFWSTQIMPESISVWILIITLYGLSRVVPDRFSLKFVALGAIIGGIAPLIKPAWQYFTLGFLLFFIINIIRNKGIKTKLALMFLLVLYCSPSVFWSVRNWIHWSVPSVSVNGPLAKTWAAKAILEGAGAERAVEIPDYSQEMAFHIGFIADHSKADWIPDRFRNVHRWDSNGLRQEMEDSQNLLPLVLQNHFALYVKSSILGTTDVLFSPQNKLIMEFLGIPVENDPKWKTMSGEHLSKKDDIIKFINARLNSPITLLWTLYGLSFLGIFYLSTFLAIPTYLKNFIFSPWTIYLVTVTPMIFLMGPLGQSRYRFTMVQPLLPIASIGLYMVLKFLKKRCVKL